MQQTVKLSTRKEIAEHFRVTPETVYRWQKKGKIKPHETINGRPRYILENIDPSKMT